MWYVSSRLSSTPHRVCRLALRVTLVVDCSRDCHDPNQTLKASLACDMFRTELPRRRCEDNRLGVMVRGIGHMSMTPMYISNSEEMLVRVNRTGDPLKLGTFDSSSGTSYKTACCFCGGT